MEAVMLFIGVVIGSVLTGKPRWGGLPVRINCPFYESKQKDGGEVNA